MSFTMTTSTSPRESSGASATSSLSSASRTPTHARGLFCAPSGLERHRRHGRWRSCDPRACERRRRPGARPRGRACPHRARGHVMDEISKPREPRDARESREARGPFQLHLAWRSSGRRCGVRGASRRRASPHHPELFNPDSLGQFVNGGLAAIIIVLLFLGTVIVSLAASLIYRLVSYKHIWYEFGDEEFSFYSGVFNKKRVHVPYRRIQSVDQTASLLQRVFGVCTVQIDTAGGASNKAVSVPFLRKADAEALRADLFARKSAAVGAPFREADAPSSFGNVLDAPAEVWDDVRGVFAGSEVDTGRISFQYGITNSEFHSHRTFEQHDAGSRRRRHHRRVLAGRRLRLANGGRGWRSRCRSARRRGPRAFRQQPHCPYRCREPSRCPCSCG